MKRIFSFILLFPLSIFAQTETHILSYDVSVVMNEQTREIAGTVRVAARIADPASAQCSFLVPKEWNINSLQNGNNDSYDKDRSSTASPKFDLITLDLDEAEQQNDTLFVNIEFTAIIDSSSSGDQFINQREFLLPCNSSASWLPHFGSLTAERFSLEFQLAPQFTVVAEAPFDTASAEGIRTWKRSASHPILLSSAFTLCGLQNAVKQTSISRDSLCSITLLSSPLQFNQQYASTLIRQLCDAVQYFTTLTKQQRITNISYVIVGDGKNGGSIFNSKNCIIQRNSPAYTVFDSASITRSAYNHWLFRLARQFCPASNESTAVFDDGFASYLAMRFLITSFPETEKQERFKTISNALTFFPSGILAAGHTSKINTNDIISSKGRYFFLMLEYLLGRESFDSVIAAMSERFSETHISFSEFQNLCEGELGSSLDWFFAQWLYRSSAPEFVLQWKSETTPRGMSIIRATIEQRGDQFSMPVPLVFSFGNRTVTKRVVMEQARQEFTFTFPSVPTSVELDPHYSILRWLLEIRISAHAKTSLQFLSISRDTINAAREALYALQLDPNNSTGSAPLAYFVLGNIAAIGGNYENAKEYFIKAASSFGTAETEPYRLLSLIRNANIMEKDNQREEAVRLYHRAITEGLKNPLIYERVITEADKYAHENFTQNDDIWFDIH